METRGPWIRHDTAPILQLARFSVYQDRVTTPAGSSSVYQWVAAPDLVRVAALDSGRRIYVVEQHHYLPNQPGMWQLPGGSVDGTEDPGEAAARELAEEIGARAGRWRRLGVVWPMPGLTTARVHLWLAEDLQLGAARPERSEADLVTRRIPLDRAVTAALDGTIGCAASAHLVLAVAATG